MFLFNGGLNKKKIVYKFLITRFLYVFSTVYMHDITMKYIKYNSLKVKGFLKKRHDHNSMYKLIITNVYL